MIKKFLKSNKALKNFNIEIIDTGLNTNIAKRIFLKPKRFTKLF